MPKEIIKIEVSVKIDYPTKDERKDAIKEARAGMLSTSGGIGMRRYTPLKTKVCVK